MNATEIILTLQYAPQRSIEWMEALQAAVDQGQIDPARQALDERDEIDQIDRIRRWPEPVSPRQ
jgi:hypothetical protein